MSNDSQQLSREDLVAQAITSWRDEFEALTAVPSLRHTTRPEHPHLDITNAHPAGLAKLMAQGRAHLSEVVREAAAQAQARRAAAAVQNDAQNWAEEYGLFTTHLGVGEVTWVPLNGAESPHMPVLLRAVELHDLGAARDDLDIWLHPATEVNPELLRALEEVGIRLDPEALVELTQGTHGFDPLPVINTLRALGEPLPGFTVRQRLVISNIVDAGPALLDELSTGAYRLQRHPVIAAIAGDVAAQVDVKRKPAPLDTETLRELEDHLVLDADPDAAQALNLARAGSHVAISAPSGTQGIETILNIVATQIAAGRKVLLVSPQRKQLEALNERAIELGLDNLMLNLGPTPQAQLDARAALAHSLAQAGEDVGQQPPEALGELHRTAKRLNDHARAVRSTRPDIGVSLLDCLENLAQIMAQAEAPVCTEIIADADVELISRQRHQVLSLLTRAAELGAFDEQTQATPWFGSRILTQADADAAVAALIAVRDEHLPAIRAAITTNAQAADLADVDTLDAFQQRLDMLDNMRTVLDELRPDVFAHDPSELIAATATKEWRAARGVDMSIFQRRKLVKQAQEFVLPTAGDVNIHERLIEVSAHREVWQQYSLSGGYPKIPEHLDSARSTLAETRKALAVVAQALPQHSDATAFSGTPFAEIEGLATGLLDDVAALETMPERNQVMQRLREAGLGGICAEFKRRQLIVDRVEPEFTFVWWSSAMQFIAAREASLAELGTREQLEQLATDFRNLDRHHIDNGKHRVRYTARLLLREAIAEHGELDANAQRTLDSLQRTSLRELLVKYSPVLTAARPCWLVSPYLVPQLVPTRALGQLEKPMFDVVILADAGLMSDAAAVAAMSRAQQVIAIGDPYQVVPAHLNRSTRARSALETCIQTLPHVALTRSTLSRSGSVEEFVQSTLFSGALNSVPSPHTGDADQLMFVNDRGGVQISPEGIVESSQSELQMLGSIVMQHAKYFPEKSLAIVAFTESHAARIMEHIMHRVALRADVAPFFDPNRPEPFVVVAAAHAASVHRDSVILSVGFTKSPHRRIVYRMGPLTSENGRQALAVALTRARTNTLVISSLRSSDFDDDKIKYDGLADLKRFLAFMEAKHHAVAAEPAVPEVAPDVTPESAPDVEVVAPESAPESAAEIESDPGPDSDPEQGRAQEQAAELVEVEGLHQPVYADPVAAPTAHENLNTVAHRVQSGHRSRHLSEIDPLLSDVADRLWFSGLTVETEFGEGDEKVTLALGSPEFPDRLLVAVEPDTRVRPLSRSVRERDRLRLERLERAGWHVERLWAWPLFLDPKGEAERLRRVVADIVADLQKPEPMPEPPPPPPEPVDRGPKPMVPDSAPLSSLTEGLWDRMLAWILSDGEPRLEEDLANELRREMGFVSRGVHIDIAVYSTIRRYQAGLAPSLVVPPELPTHE